MAQAIYYSKWTVVKSDTRTVVWISKGWSLHNNEKPCSNFQKTVPVLDTCTGIGFCTAKLERPGIQLAWALVQIFYCMLFTRFKLT